MDDVWCLSSVRFSAAALAVSIFSRKCVEDTALGKGREEAVGAAGDAVDRDDGGRATIEVDADVSTMLDESTHPNVCQNRLVAQPIRDVAPSCVTCKMARFTR
jgi:hypothetical protein